MVETFLDIDDLEAAVAAIRSVSSLPIVGLMSFDAEGETLTGVSARVAEICASCCAICLSVIETCDSRIPGFARFA